MKSQRDKGLTGGQSGAARAVALSVLSLALVGGFAAMLLRPATAVPERATVLPEPMALPEFALVDQQDRAFTRTSFEGRWSLIFFGFTNCPDICPLTLKQLAIARKSLATRRGNESLPSIVFVSVDPERDTAEAIAAYADAFGEGVTGVRGDLGEIDKLASALGIFHARPARADGAYDVEHSAAVIVINRDAEFHAVFGAPHDAETIAGDMMLIMGAG